MPTKKQGKPEPITCGICTELILKERVQLRNCKHVFHPLCLKQWIDTEWINSKGDAVTCPYCRGKLTSHNKFAASQMTASEKNELIEDLKKLILAWSDFKKLSSKNENNNNVLKKQFISTIKLQKMQQSLRKKYWDKYRLDLDMMDVAADMIPEYAMNKLY
jgi:hypothetical protein